MSAFGKLARQVSRGMARAGARIAATLIKVTPGTRTPGNVSAGTNATFASYPCFGWIADFQATEIDGSLVVVGDRKATLLGATIAAGIAPSPDDKIAIAGATYRVIHVQADAASAQFVCHVRGAPIP